MKIEITAQDIEIGEPARHDKPCEDHNIYPCPIALALMRALSDTPCPDGCGQPCVSIGSAIYIGQPYPLKTVPIPEQLVVWMRKWDAGRKMKPATFEVPGL